MGLFDSFKKRKETDVSSMRPTAFPFSNDELPMLPQEPSKVTYLDESILHDDSMHNETPTMVTNFRNSSLESLCRRIDEENAQVERQVADMKKRVKELNLNNPEILDLLDIYEKTKEKLDDFVKEIDRFDSIGWGTDENTAALYKFRACKGLANMMRQKREIEKLSKDAGFTPDKVQEILKTPAAKLVDGLFTNQRRKK